MIDVGGRQGRDCEGCRQATVAALLGIWPLLRDTVRRLDLGDWLAIASVVAAIGAVWSRG